MTRSWITRLVWVAGVLFWPNAGIAEPTAPPEQMDESTAPRASFDHAGRSTVTPRPEPVIVPAVVQPQSDATRVIVHDGQPASAAKWLSDVLVTDPTGDQVKPAMTKAPDGTLFIAAEELGTGAGWIRLFRSTDGGTSWVTLASFATGATSRNPSIAYVQQSSGDKWIFVTYEATYADSTKGIPVIRLNPDSLLWSFATAVSGITGVTDLYPRVCTDNLIWDDYYVYVTYTDDAFDYYPVMFTRSLDGGSSFTSPQNLTGGAENSGFLTRPAITYGTAGLIVAFEKLGWTGSAWETQVWVTRSTSFGASWDAPLQLTTAAYGAWHPSVAAAIGVDTVMVTYTRGYELDTDIHCAYSTDGGLNYTLNRTLPWTTDDETSVALTVSDSGGRYHAAFWRNYDIHYTSTDAGTPWPWAATTVVNEANFASLSYALPAICVDPTRSLDAEACVAWTDFRGAYYDIYFDAAFREGACCLPDAVCTETIESTCLEGGGTWFGEGSTCDPNPCLVDPCAEDEQAPLAILPVGDFQCVPAMDPTPIWGTATDPENNLANWQLEERAMGAAPWGPVASGFSPMDDDVLANWVPAANGYRMLRLTVADTCGHVSTAARLLYADQGPHATINYPTDGTVIGGTNVCIDGLLRHGVCGIEWIVEQRPAAGSWAALAAGTSSIHNLPLTHWNTTTVADGQYDIRATVASIGGMATDTVAVTVDNTSPIAALDAPLNCTWVDGVVEIHGTAFDVNLAQWNLYWTGGPSSGWTWITSGATSTSGLLATWDVTGLPHCAYTLRLVAHDRARINCTNDVHSSVALVSVQVGSPPDDPDLDGDGDVDLVDYQMFADAFTGPM